MKQSLNEIKRMQQLAGIKLNELEVNDPSLVSYTNQVDRFKGVLKMEGIMWEYYISLNEKGKSLLLGIEWTEFDNNPKLQNLLNNDRNVNFNGDEIDDEFNNDDENKINEEGWYNLLSNIADKLNKISIECNVINNGYGDTWYMLYIPNFDKYNAFRKLDFK